MTKLYIAVRDDIPAGLQAAQISHASFAFAHEHPDLTATWLRASNYLVIVSVPDEGALLDLIYAASMRGILRTAVREPDLNEEVTAVALAPGSPAARLCANLPLALRNKNGLSTRERPSGIPALADSGATVPP